MQHLLDKKIERARIGKQEITFQSIYKCALVQLESHLFSVNDFHDNAWQKLRLWFSDKFIESICSMQNKANAHRHTVALALHNQPEWMDDGLKQQAFKLLDLDIN